MASTKDAIFNQVGKLLIFFFFNRSFSGNVLNIQKLALLYFKYTSKIKKEMVRILQICWAFRLKKIQLSPSGVLFVAPNRPLAGAEGVVVSGNRAIDISFLLNPGVYEILDTGNNFSYFGESECLLDRLQMHKRQLVNGTHSCTALRESFIQQGSDFSKFQFLVIVSGPEWACVKKRRALEEQLIDDKKQACYNQTTAAVYKTGDFLKRPIMYNGKRYESVRGALKDTDHVKVSRATLKRQLLDQTKPDVYFIEGEEGVPVGSMPLFARKDDGPLLLFPSLKAVVRARYASSIYSAREKAEKNIDGWRFALFDKYGRPTRGSYKPQQGDLTYEEFINNKKD